MLVAFFSGKSACEENEKNTEILLLEIRNRRYKTLFIFS